MLQFFPLHIHNWDQNGEKMQPLSKVHVKEQNVSRSRNSKELACIKVIASFNSSEILTKRFDVLQLIKNNCFISFSYDACVFHRANQSYIDDFSLISA